MKPLFGSIAFVVTLTAWIPWAGAVEPYIQIEVGVVSRDVIEEDPTLSEFKFRGDAVSTRLIAKLGLDLDVVNVYLQGGWADLAIDEFNDYDASLSGAYGGGVRLNLYRSPYRDRVTLFVEGSYLRYTTDDQIETVVSCDARLGCPANTGIDYPLLADETIQWNEYTVLLGASGRYEGFNPYGGIRLSKLDGTDRIRTAPDSNFPSGFRANPDLKEDDNFGIFGGLNIFLDRSESTALNFEISLIDQDSFRAAIRRAF